MNQTRDLVLALVVEFMPRTTWRTFDDAVEVEYEYEAEDEVEIS